MANAKAPLLERERELEIVAEALAAARRGHGSLVLVEGPPGIGKTSVVQHALAAARARRLQVLTGSGAELEREFPFGVARQLLEEVARDAPDAMTGAAAQAGLLFEPRLAQAPAPDAFAIVHALYWLTANLADRGPLLVAVDDVQWADELSARWLTYLARRIADLPIVLVVAARRTEWDVPAPPADALWALENARRLWLEPLSGTGVKSLVAAELRTDPGGGFVEACRAATGGNPFLVAELARALKADGVRPDDEQAMRVDEIRPRAVETAILLRLGRLSAEAVRLARAVAVLGGSATLGEAARTAGLGRGLASAALEELVGAAILDPGTPLRYIHPLVLGTVYDDFASAQRAQLHASAAAALRGTATPERVAAQLMLAERSAERWERDTLREAAAEARSRGAPRVAADYLRRALERAGEGERRGILLELGLAGMQFGDRDAPDYLAEAHRTSSTLAERAESARALAVALGPIRRGMEAAELLAEVAAEAAGVDRELELLLEAEAAMFAQLVSGSRRKVLERLEERLPGLSGATPGERALMAAYACYGLYRGLPIPQLGPIAATALGEGKLVAEQTPERPTPYVTADVAAQAGLRGVAERAFDDLATASRRRGSVFGVMATASSRALAAWHIWGELAEAEATAIAALEAAAETRWTANVPWAIAGLVGSLVDQGRVAEAEAALEDNNLAGELNLAAAQAFAWVAYARAHLRAASRHWEAAAADLTLVGKFHPAHSPLPYRADAAVALARMGDVDAATTLAEQEVERCNRSGTPRHRGIATRALGLVRGDSGLLRKATELLADGGNPVEHARGLLELGAALRREGRRADARQPLLEALDLAHRAGARLLAGAAKEELAATGARPRHELLSGIEALTASELRVARLAADGLSNPHIAQSLFVSRKTVEMHLGRVYRKLDISSREDLPDALAGA